MIHAHVGDSMDLTERLIRPNLFVFLIIAVLVLTAYSFMLGAPFRSMDDATTIVENPDIRDFKNVPKVLTGSFFGDSSYYRPLVTISYMLEYHMFGLNAFWFNFNNVLLHVLNSFCVFALIYRLWNKSSTALAVCLLFAIHPVHWEAVSNISGRSILLNTMYVLMAFCLFIDFNKHRRILYLFGSLTSFVLALLCKESAAILPVTLILYLLFLSKENKKPWFALVLFFLVVFGFILFRKQLGITQLFAWGSWDALALGVLTFARGVITYLRLFIFPVDLYFDRSLKVLGSFMDPQLLATLIFWIAAALVLWFNRKKAGTPAVFLALWFLIELAPVSQIVTSIGVQPGFISLAEHFLYVPSIAALTLIVLGVQHLWHLNEQSKVCSTSIAAAGILGFLIFLFLTTIQQTVYAGNELAMLKRSAEMQPFNSRVQYSIGMNYVNRGMFQAAEVYFRQAVSMDPWNVRAMIALGKSLCDQGRYHEGMSVYRSIRDAGTFGDILKENMRLSQKIIDNLSLGH